ncbi:MAG TPA: MotA/TolQ/ExbB proton channel family protein [bacterium]|nr:MotA/TolQ/ExbB proton channel family protein [bacterium]
MAVLIQVLYYVTTTLLVPVIILLLGLMAFSLFDVGRFIHELVERAVIKRKFEVDVQAGDEKKAVSASKDYITGTVLASGLISEEGRLSISAKNIDGLLTQMELRANSICSRSALRGRVAQVLGLIGTLIPMGPALIGLSSGNMEEMATNLVVAFSTTVVGLLTNILCMAITSIRRNWYAGDLAAIELIGDKIDDGERSEK